MRSRRACGLLLQARLKQAAFRTLELEWLWALAP